MKKLLVVVTVVSAAWMLGASERCVWIDERKALAREPFCMVRINETRPGSVDGYWFDLPMGLTRASATDRLIGDRVCGDFDPSDAGCAEVG